MKIPEKYTLRCKNPSMEGRPCWLQKVHGTKDLYIAAQAMKPGEKGFPCVQTLLVTISAGGEISSYGDNEVLGILKTGTGAPRNSPSVIEWIDGTGVSWIEA